MAKHVSLTTLLKQFSDALKADGITIDQELENMRAFKVVVESMPPISVDQDRAALAAILDTLPLQHSADLGKIVASSLGGGVRTTKEIMLDLAGCALEFLNATKVLLGGTAPQEQVETFGQLESAQMEENMLGYVLLKRLDERREEFLKRLGQ